MRIPAEISIMTMSPNKKDLCFATLERNSHFKLIDSTTHSILKIFNINKLVCPLLMEFSSDSKYLVV